MRKRAGRAADLNHPCEFCGHETYEYPTAWYCPCQDCHVGGALMFKEVSKPSRKLGAKLEAGRVRAGS